MRWLSFVLCAGIGCEVGVVGLLNGAFLSCGSVEVFEVVLLCGGKISMGCRMNVMVLVRLCIRISIRFFVL